MKLYVGNLSYRLTEDEFRSAFAAHGEVASANIVIDRETGKSKGFGFIEMPVDSEAESAMEQLNGSDLGGRPLRIDKARPSKPRPQTQRRFHGR